MMRHLWDYVRKPISRLRRRRRSGPLRRDGRTNLLSHELLEPRRLLSATQITFDTNIAQIVIRGTGIDDQVVVSSDLSGMINVRAVTGSEVVEMSFLKTAVSSIDFGGGGGNDRFENATDLPSRASGDSGNDVLIGGSGDDFMLGGDGDDVLIGNAGNDDLRGQSGNDELWGLDGNDELSGGTGNDLLLGGNGNDRLVGEWGHDDLRGEDGDDQLLGMDGNDNLSGGAGKDNLLGGIGNDLLLGDGGDDVLAGQEGDDFLFGGDGNDQLNGNSGNDYLVGGLGNDQLNGEIGDDRLDGQDGNDILIGLDGNDKLFGGAGDDQLFGGTGNDQLVGHGGDDLLAGQEDDDFLWGREGNDHLNGNSGNDYLLGGSGDDELNGDAGDDRLDGQDGNDILIGLDGNDTLFGGAGIDQLFGGTGNDELSGDGGDDVLAGQEGDDLLWGRDGNDHLNGNSGNDHLVGGSGDDELTGDAGDDRLEGQDGNDVLNGLDGNDMLFGGAGNDQLFGGTGNDELAGDGGDDLLAGQEDDDLLWGRDGNDKLNGNSGNDHLVGGSGDDQLTGDEGNDRLEGQDGNDVLNGLDGNDMLFGGAGIDQLFGGTGNDELTGDGGDDLLAGQEGDDLLWGRDGNDKLNGNSGNDDLAGGSGDDQLTGDEGDDRLEGQDGNDVLNGLDGNDKLFGGAGNDQLFGGTGNDELVGDGGDDELRGEGGNDLLLGMDGNDTIYGGNERDLLIGGLGVDRLLGGSDSDILIGGITIYDDDAAALNAPLSVWSSAAPYATRIQTIEDELFAVRIESEETVFDDQVADELFGDDGEDWFIQTGFMGVYSPVGGEAGGNDHASFVSNELPELEGFDLIDSLDKMSDRLTTEAIHSKLPHATSGVRQLEHLALFELARYDQVTHYAVTSGAWSNPATWHDGVVPGDGARVLIPIGVEVTVDGVIPTRLATIRLDGTLSFAATTDTELRVDTIIGSGSSRFEMGTSEQPIPAGITARLLITDNGPIDRTWDPFGISRGLITHGSVVMHGAERTSHAAVQGSVSAGTSMLVLENIPVGWNIGDSVVLASTTEGTEQNEVREIVAIFGAIIVLGQPLSYDHVPPAAGLQVHVANLTRNVAIESEGLSIERRGHVMFMHNRDVEIANAGFYHLGRTNKLLPINDSVVDANWNLQPGTGTNQRARYAVHFHRNGLVNDGNPSVVRGSVVVDAPGWGYVNHSSYVDMLDNLAFDVKGAAFSTEVGDEIGSFDGNIAIGTIGSGDSTESRTVLQDFGHEGDGFWLQGAGVSVTNNIAAGNQGSAFAFYTRGLIEGGVQGQFLSANLPDPSLAGGAETIAVGKVPVSDFRNNVGYASAIGLSVWFQLQSAAHQQQAVFEDSQFWNNTTGVYVPYTRQTVLRNLSVIHSPDVMPPVGVGMNIVTRDITYDNLTVTGYDRGIEVARSGYALVQGGNFDNHIDILVQTGVSSTRSVLLTGFAGLPRVVMGSAFDPISGSVAHIFLQDTVVIDYGPFVNQRLYYRWQRAGAVPFPEPRVGLPAEYVGLTTQQLWDQYGIAVGGEIAPSDVIEVPSITGLIGPPI